MYAMLGQYDRWKSQRLRVFKSSKVHSWPLIGRCDKHTALPYLYIMVKLRLLLKLFKYLIVSLCC